MIRPLETQDFLKSAVGILAGAMLVSCGTSSYDAGAAQDDEVAASIRTHKEFERYWSQRRAGGPAEPAQTESYASSEPAEVEAYTPEETVAEVEYVEEDSGGPAAEWESSQDNPYADTPASKKDAKVAVTWFEYQGDTGRGSRDYSSIAGGGFPSALKVRGSRKYVRSPYNGQYVDVSNMPKGVLVADPNYPLSQRNYFLIP